jgi:hypothetical protein
MINIFDWPHSSFKKPNYAMSIEPLSVYKKTGIASANLRSSFFAGISTVLPE